jgi:hypothetical protein
MTYVRTHPVVSRGPVAVELMISHVLVTRAGQVGIVRTRQLLKTQTDAQTILVYMGALVPAEEIVSGVNVQQGLEESFVRRTLTSAYLNHV